jgi:hypothetical protein
MTSRQRFALLLVSLAVLGGCATEMPAARRGENPPRVRCLANPAEGATRPLFFFFCAESP